MAIIFDKEKKMFHLFNEEISYLMSIHEKKYLLHNYYGERIDKISSKLEYPKIDRSSFSPNPYELSGQNFSLNVVLQEFPAYDTGDYREGMYEFTFADGTKASCMKYHSHNIYAGKNKLSGLPATYADNAEDVDSLEIILRDDVREVEAVLTYSIFNKISVITKSVKYTNLGKENIILNKALSSCIDMGDSNFEMIQMPGAWAREKQYERRSLLNGIHVLDSKRGASGVSHQPFVALARPETNELSGEVFAFHFVYSGNFVIKTEVDAFEQTRVLVGINDFNFSWNLKTGESFQTPEVVMVYSNKGLNKMSQAFHKLYRNNLARGKYRDLERPILINNWESTYFDYNEEKLLGLAKKAKAMGVELFVLDDGWFGQRNSDTTSLGDWFENKEKLPNGLKGLSEKIKNLGLKFGLWFEPEMISEQSELFRAHPDWHIHVKNYSTSMGRNQLILDFSRQEVREEIYNQLVKILDNVSIDYIKWDMNRNMTEVGSLATAPEKQMEVSHRYILGLYEILERLISRYPNILFENCSGGGGRFDPGMCYYMPQSWASDNTDAIERLKIQYSTSMVFPPIMICAQLSESPNHQIGRLTPLKSRAAVSMSANFGLMYDLLNTEDKEIEKITSYIQWYKERRELIQFGHFYRIQNPYDSNFGSWIFVNEDKTRAVLIYVQILTKASNPLNKIKLVGLEKSFEYRVNGEIMTGSELMNFGIYMNHDLIGDFQCKIIDITAN